jgi:hypothetical protein
MLAGREDVKPLLYYNSNIGEVASDDGLVFNGAYGYRWRHVPGEEDKTPNGQSVDQLPIIIDQLKRKPESRRAVLSMWNVVSDLLKIDTTKDVCCNTHVYFLINRGRLDMTVCNRSNDLIWGMLGANVVHFSFLQEYVAQSVGVPIGRYNQFTNNLHVYEANWQPSKWLSCSITPYPSEFHLDLVRDRPTFDRECAEFVEDIDTAVTEPFLKHVAAPMCLAFRHHKEKDYRRSFEALRLVAMNDWQEAAHTWLAKREKVHRVKYGEKTDDNPYLFREFKRQTSGSDQA